MATPVAHEATKRRRGVPPLPFTPFIARRYKMGLVVVLVSPQTLLAVRPYSGRPWVSQATTAILTVYRRRSFGQRTRSPGSRRVVGRLGEAMQIPLQLLHRLWLW